MTRTGGSFECRPVALCLRMSAVHHPVEKFSAHAAGFGEAFSSRAGVAGTSGASVSGAAEGNPRPPGSAVGFAEDLWETPAPEVEDQNEPLAGGSRSRFPPFRAALC